MPPSAGCEGRASLWGRAKAPNTSVPTGSESSQSCSCHRAAPWFIWQILNQQTDLLWRIWLVAVSIRGSGGAAAQGELHPNHPAPDLLTQQDHACPLTRQILVPFSASPTPLSGFWFSADSHFLGSDSPFSLSRRGGTKRKLYFTLNSLGTERDRTDLKQLQEDTFSKRIFSLLSWLLHSPKIFHIKELEHRQHKKCQTTSGTPVQPRHDAIITPWHEQLEGRVKARFPTSIQVLASVSRRPNLTFTLMVFSVLGCNMDTCPQRTGL